MKLLFITLSAIFGNFAIAALPQANVQPPTQTQSFNTSQYLSKLQSKVQLVQDMEINLNSFNIDKKLNEETEKINDYSATFSSKVQTLVSGIRPLILTSHDRIFDAVSIMHGWCSSADVLLDAFLGLFTSNDIASRNEVLQGLLDSDSSTELVDKLKKATDTLHNASTLVSSILTEFESDFTVKSPLFEVLLRYEILNDENKHYSANLINAVMKEMKKYIQHPELLGQILSTNNLASAAGSVVGIPTNRQAQSTTEQAPKETTVNPQVYLRFRDLVLNRFESTTKFFTNYKSNIDRTISSVEEIKAKVLGNNQRGDVIGNVQPQSPPNRASDEKLKNAAKALKNNCQQFTTSSAKY